MSTYKQIKLICSIRQKLTDIRQNHFLDNMEDSVKIFTYLMSNNLDESKIDELIMLF